MGELVSGVPDNFDHLFDPCWWCTITCNICNIVLYSADSLRVHYNKHNSVQQNDITEEGNDFENPCEFEVKLHLDDFEDETKDIKEEPEPKLLKNLKLQGTTITIKKACETNVNVQNSKGTSSRQLEPSENPETSLEGDVGDQFKDLMKYPKQQNINQHFKMRNEHFLKLAQLKYSTAHANLTPTKKLIKNKKLKKDVKETVDNIEKKVKKVEEVLHLCNYCGYKTNRSANLQNHVLSVHEKWKEENRDRLKVCSYCGYKTAYKQNLNTHIAYMHEGVARPRPTEKKNRCPQCDFKTVRGGNLREHIRSVHFGIKRVKKKDRTGLEAI